jgi:segregation and condensation protein A
MTLEEENLGKVKRGNVIREVKKLAEISNVEAELQDLDLYKLLKAFEIAMDTFISESEQNAHTIMQYPYTIEEQKDYILTQLSKKEKLSFTEIIAYNPLKIAVIYNFLAILEILQAHQVSISIGEGFNNFWLKANIEKVAS